jgi:hypothetical protein
MYCIDSSTTVGGVETLGSSKESKIAKFQNAKNIRCKQSYLGEVIHGGRSAISQEVAL